MYLPPIPPHLLPIADAMVSGTTTAGNVWSTNTAIRAFGTQATADFYTSGSTANGVTVTVARSSLAGAASNGVTITVTTKTSGTLTATYNATNKTIAVARRTNSTMAQLRTALNAITGLSAAYLGSESGTGTFGGNAESETTGGTRDESAWVRIACAIAGTGSREGLWVDTGTSAPANTNSARLIPAGSFSFYPLPAGQDIYWRRTGSANMNYSLELFRNVQSPNP